jgi:hypothetical protein
MLGDLIRTFATTDEQVAEFDAMLEDPRHASLVAEIDVHALPASDRELMIAHAVVLGSIDGLSMDEEAMIGELARRMHLPPMLERKIVAGAKERARRLLQRSNTGPSGRGSGS